MPPRLSILAGPIAAAFLLAACASAPVAGPQPDESDDAIHAPRDGFSLIREAFLTPNTPADNIDSPASWTDADGRTWLIATAKATDKLVLYDADTGQAVREWGGPGTGLGALDRPNGISVIDDLLMVVERDNHRVQVLSLPGLEPLGTFGEADLVQPYGLWVHRVGSGDLEVLVSDNYMSAGDEDLPPPLDQLDRRIKRYRLDSTALEAGKVDATLAGTLGDTSATGAIRITESLWGDVANNRLLIAEEDQATGTLLRDYSLDGRYRGRDIGAGIFKAQAEGIALWQCNDGSGYWIATDQFSDRSLFHVFDRQSLEHMGAFAGATVANTDGVWLQQGATTRFPTGVFYAVNDDQGVGAFDWRDIARTLDLKESCATG